MKLTFNYIPLITAIEISDLMTKNNSWHAATSKIETHIPIKRKILPNILS
jgi:hypothetical protein